MPTRLTRSVFHPQVRMMMCRAVNMLIAAALAFAMPGSAPAATAVATAQVTIVEGSAVRMNLATAPASVRGTRDGAAFAGTAPSMLLSIMMLPGNARLTVRRDDDSGVPVTAPASFEVFGTEGDSTLIVRTTGSSEVRIVRNGVILDGALQGGSAASIDVAGGLTPISSGGQSSGFNSATLVVVVQYN